MLGKIAFLLPRPRFCSVVVVAHFDGDADLVFREKPLKAVVHWNNAQVALLLRCLNIDLNLYYCPDPKTLIQKQAEELRLTCCHHKHVDPTYIGMCAEETAFNLAEWLIQNSPTTLRPS